MDGRCRGLLCAKWPPAARFPSTTPGASKTEDPLSSAACRRAARPCTLKAQLASEVAHIRQLRPDVRIVAIADAAADNWTFLETLSPETEVIDFWHACEHLRTASDHAVVSDWFERYREVLRHDPCGVDKVIRALRHLRDSAKPDRAEIERELAFFRKHRQRMRYHALKAEGVAIGSGVVEAANKTLVTQRMKRSGMRWRIASGQAVLTESAP